MWSVTFYESLNVQIFFKFVYKTIRSERTVMALGVFNKPNICTRERTRNPHHALCNKSGAIKTTKYTRKTTPAMKHLYLCTIDHKLNFRSACVCLSDLQCACLQSRWWTSVCGVVVACVCVIVCVYLRSGVLASVSLEISATLKEVYGDLYCKNIENNDYLWFFYNNIIFNVTT